MQSASDWNQAQRQREMMEERRRQQREAERRQQVQAKIQQIREEQKMLKQQREARAQATKDLKATKSNLQLANKLLPKDMSPQERELIMEQIGPDRKATSKLIRSIRSPKEPSGDRGTQTERDRARVNYLLSGAVPPEQWSPSDKLLVDQHHAKQSMARGRQDIQGPGPLFETPKRWEEQEEKADIENQAKMTFQMLEPVNPETGDLYSYEEWRQLPETQLQYGRYTSYQQKPPQATAQSTANIDAQIQQGLEEIRRLDEQINSIRQMMGMQ